MRRYNNYILGTINELAEDIYAHVYECGITHKKFGGVDFTIPSPTDFNLEKDSLEYIFSETDGGYYGIKQIDTGFDNCYNIDLFADYYGGGCGNYAEFDWNIPEENRKSRIKHLITKTLSLREEIDADTLIIAEHLSEE